MPGPVRISASFNSQIPQITINVFNSYGFTVQPTGNTPPYNYNFYDNQTPPTTFSNMFKNNISLLNITLYGGFPVIKYDAFMNCSNLTSVDMSGVITIENGYNYNIIGAFYRCSSLTTITALNIQTIGNQAFNYCTSLETITAPNLQTIGNLAFYECISLTTITAPKLETIGNQAFHFCERLETITAQNLQTIGNYAFNDCRSLKTITAPNLQTIGNSAFYQCYSLTTINAPNLQTIGNLAFEECISLTDITAPNIQTIGNSAFYQCESLETITAPNLQTIGNYAFYQCESLNTITINCNTSFDVVMFAYYNTPSLRTAYIRVPYTDTVISNINSITSKPSYMNFNINVKRKLQLYDIPITITNTNITIDQNRNVEITIQSINIPNDDLYDSSFVMKYTTDNGTSWNDCTYDNTQNKIILTLGTRALQPEYTVNLQTYYQSNMLPSSSISAPVSVYTIEPTPTQILSNICFPSSTLVKTDQGYIEVCKIDINVHKINNQKIIAITQIISIDDYLVCFEKNALANNVPFVTTKLSKNHLVYNNGIFRPAESFLAKHPKIYKVKYTGETLYNVLMETHQKINVNNMTCESLHPENNIAKIYIQRVRESSNSGTLILDNDSYVTNKICNNSINNYNKHYNRFRMTNIY